MSTAFHPQTDGNSERKIRDIESIMRTMVSANQSDWVEKIPMVQFALNSGKSGSTTFAPFEINKTYMPTLLPTMIPRSSLKGVADFIGNTRANLVMARDAMIESRIKQTFYANKNRHEDHNTYEAGESVYLSTKNLTLPKGRAHKLLPKFLGPYTIKKGDKATSRYHLNLPEYFKKRRIHPVFHVSLLRPHFPNDDELFPNRDIDHPYELDIRGEDGEYFASEILAHNFYDIPIKKGKKIIGQTPSIEFHVKWDMGDTTWEDITNVDELVILDDYLKLHGATKWQDLPHAHGRKLK